MPLHAPENTQIFGIFGNPIRHTLSPQMHNAAFEALGISGTYLPFEVQPGQLEKAVDAIVPLGIRGVNVTIPYKEKVIPFLDQIDPGAKKIGAVNTIKNHSGRLIGFNTDGEGFIASLLEIEADPVGMSVILLGAGGAAKGVAVALLSAGVSEIIIMARNEASGSGLADRLKGLSSRPKISSIGFDLEKRVPIPKGSQILLVNTTPLGMRKGDPIPFPPSLIKPDWVVSDLIYRPFETPLLVEAKTIGAKIVPGFGMLLHQGALAFKIWTSLDPPIPVMRKSLRKALSNTGQ